MYRGAVAGGVGVSARKEEQDKRAKMALDKAFLKIDGQWSE